MQQKEIACPKCNWEPSPDSRWMCDCGHVWNTFDTGGRCPACGKQWKYTCCLSCHEWSLHVDWYRFPVDLLDELLKEEAEVLHSLCVSRGDAATRREIRICLGRALSLLVSTPLNEQSSNL